MAGESITPGTLAQSMIQPEPIVHESPPAEIDSDCNRLLPMQPVVMKPTPESPQSVVPPSASPESKVEPRAASFGSPKAPSNLTSHLDGLRTLPVHSPVCKSIELAVDESGQMHLLARDVDVSSIPAVQNWIRSHQDLLQMAMPDVRFEEPGSIRIHVLGQDVNVLCGLRGTGWHPHLLVRVDESNRGDWTQVSLED